ncbi:MAG: metal-dependent phosphohydrolase [Alphaproteobacteria bacterium]|nr:metal-dependent phosphohydrolase [Alphaproteobacteria bacterium]
MSDIRTVLAELYEAKAARRYGLSRVNQRQHALQSASLAEAEGHTPALVVAALLHDVGHLIHDLGENPAAKGIDDAHETRAADWLAVHFGPEVTEPVRLHVPAKRYLCAVEADYFAKLSEDSVRSLKLQGGPMSADEVAQFERLAHAQEAVALRRIDERAKDPTAGTPPFTYYLTLIEAALAAHAAQSATA